MNTRFTIIAALTAASIATIASPADARRYHDTKTGPHFSTPGAQPGFNFFGSHMVERNGQWVYAPPGTAQPAVRPVWHHRKARKPARAPSRAVSHQAAPILASIPLPTPRNSTHGIPIGSPEPLPPPPDLIVAARIFEPMGRRAVPDILTEPVLGHEIAPPDLVAAMKVDLGRNPTGWGHLWCARYLNMVLARLGLRPMTGDSRNIARSFRGYGNAAQPGTKGAIVVSSGHVAVATGRTCKGGNVETISGNSTGRVVAINCEMRARIIAWRMPIGVPEVVRNRDQIDLADRSAKPILRTPTKLTDLALYAYNEYLAEKPARIALATIGAAPIGDARKELLLAADAFGLNRDYMLAVAKVESGFACKQTTGQYKGTFQLSNHEFDTHLGGGGIMDCRRNAFAAASKFVTEKILFEHFVGREAAFEDMYLVHQQGLGGAIAHLTHPDRIAWRSMCATEEGIEKGAAWCKRAIWGNTLPAIKARAGSVEKLTSGEFVDHWNRRIAGLVGGTAPAFETASVKPASADRRKRAHHRGARMAYYQSSKESYNAGAEIPR